MVRGTFYYNCNFIFRPHWNWYNGNIQWKWPGTNMNACSCNRLITQPSSLYRHQPKMRPNAAYHLTSKCKHTFTNGQLSGLGRCVLSGIRYLPYSNAYNRTGFYSDISALSTYVRMGHQVNRFLTKGDLKNLLGDPHTSLIRNRVHSFIAKAFSPH